MTVQTDLLAAMKVFDARLDDANARFERSRDDAGAAATVNYLSQQTVLLTDLSAALCNAVVAVADRLDALER